MEAVGQLTGGIAHDFNNLLTGIIGIARPDAQAPLRQGRLGHVERYIEAAQAAAKRAAALTHRLLAFARRQPLDPKPVDAERAGRGMEDLLRRTLGEAIQLEVVGAGGLWPTWPTRTSSRTRCSTWRSTPATRCRRAASSTIETANAQLDDT